MASAKRSRLSPVSWSSMPMRHLTVTGTSVASRMARTHAATSAGSAIRQAPKRPDCTRSEGQPTLRLISAKPASAAMRLASASSAGSEPPSCTARGCSAGS